MTIGAVTVQTAGSTGNGVTTAFSFSFHVDDYGDTEAEDQIEVIRETIATGAEEILVRTTDYTVSINGDQDASPGGIVTMLSAPSSSFKIWIRLAPDFTQQTDYQNQGGFLMETVEDQADQHTRQILALKDMARRAPRVGIQAGTSFDGEMTGDLTAGYVPIINGDLDGWTMGTPVAGVTASAAMAAVMAEETTDEAVGALNGVLEVATKAALSALTAGVVDAVVVRGRSSSGDGYEGTFHWRSGDQSSNITADPAGALWVAPDSDTDGSSGAWQRIYYGAVQASWFAPTKDGSTDDLTPLTRFINSVMTSPNRRGELQAGVYAISGALPQINVSGVEIVGCGPVTSHDVGSASTGGTTIIKAITNSGFTMMTVAPTDGASNQRLDGNRILGITFDCNSLAAKGLLWKSVQRGEIDITVLEATTSGLEFDVATTLGEAASTQRNVVRFVGRQVTNSAAALRLKGSSTQNTSFNQFEYVDVVHYDGTGVILENADNNAWHDLRIFRAGGGSATYSIEWRGGSANAERVRAEWVYQLSSTVAGVVRGYSSYTYPATGIVIDALDIENGTPEPTVEAGGTARWGNGQAADANEPGHNLIINGDFALNQLAPATNADKTAGFDGGVVLTETDTVALTSVSGPETGQAQCMRMTQSQAVAQRMGYMFVVSSEDTIPLRGEGVALAARIRCSATADIRCAILEWTGTADAVAGDIVADWTSTTYTTAGFFESTTKNVLTVVETAATAATWRDLAGPISVGGITATVGASANNLIVFIWTEGAAAQNVTLDIGKIRLLRGYMPVRDFPAERRAIAIERCERIVQKTYNLSVAPATSTGVGAVHHNSQGNAQQSRWWAPFRTRMRTTPTCTVYSQTGASANVRDVTAGADIAASTTGAGEDGVAAFPTANTTDTNIITFHVVATAYPWT